MSREHDLTELPGHKEIAHVFDQSRCPRTDQGDTN
jgi:hypothetical protein